MNEKKSFVFNNALVRNWLTIIFFGFFWAFYYE